MPDEAGGGGGGGLKGRFAAAPGTRRTLLALLMLLVMSHAAVKDCSFPSTYSGRWFQMGKEGPIIANSTHLLDRRCIARKGNDTFLTYDENTEKCYRCMIFTERHENVIQYRESSYCLSYEVDLDTACGELASDDSLYSMFRIDAKPISCPFSGMPFSFSYNRGHGDCEALENQAESCTDDSKLLLKYQACADIKGAESSTEELQCLATWKDGRIMYLLGTLKVPGRPQVYEDTYRCFLYEKIHHSNKTEYLISQSGDQSCNGLTAVTEGARTFHFIKVDKEHTKCKYPSWVTQHHDWHLLDGSRSYHFTTGNSTLKVTYRDEYDREEKVICHNLEKVQSDHRGTTVKLVAHVTSGCDTGYVCMIFRKRDGHVIEIQQSSQKMIMPHEACSLDDPSKQRFDTLITSNLHKRSCPQPGRYTVLDLVSTPQLKLSRHHRSLVIKRSYAEDSNEAGMPNDDCQNADVQIGCTSSGQNEMIIQESCKRTDMVSAYSCHGSWEENGTWYTIVSRNKTDLEKETLCVSMRVSESTKELPGRVGRVEQQELWLSRPQTVCQRSVSADQWTYKLANQGVCEDLMRAASSSAASSSLMRVSVGLSVGLTLLCGILSR
ncbi:uncharacterized protein LOC131665520 isoform X1 [Phymastichus coffea]|uniref:uncharacterized protein LOC131665520 isoform X1 n=2 Tax=Phymastichus coffea TaxID=108790 RepID=UPI00273AF9C2|nr:uncharacterized protein LOC131665520 isoform X1 [Phymastichus coffea]